MARPLLIVNNNRQLFGPNFLQSKSLQSLVVSLSFIPRPSPTTTSLTIINAPLITLMPFSRGQREKKKTSLNFNFITCRSVKTSIIPVSSLPKIAENPCFNTIDYESPEHQTVLGKAVITAQRQYPGCVVLTRVGGFWELYFEQAVEIAPLLDLKLTRKKFSSEFCPCAGFPIRSLDKYLELLINEHGRSVALCDELPNDDGEDGKLKFKRRVTRIITPGTLIDESFLEHDQNNFLLAVAFNEMSPITGLAWVDISTGEFFMQKSTINSLHNDLARIRPSEILLSDICKSSKVNPHSIWSYIDKNEFSISFQPENTFDANHSQPWQKEYEAENTAIINEVFSPVELQASAALFQYVGKNLFGRTLKLESPIRVDPKDTMIIDATALHSLEVTTSMRDNTKKGSLLHSVQRTKTASGTRTLNRWLRLPSTSISVINVRQELVEYFRENTHLTSDVRKLLGESDDAQRMTQRLSLERGGPEDIIKLKRTIKSMKSLQDRLRRELIFRPNASVEGFIDRVKPQDDLMKLIEDAIDEEALIKLQEDKEKFEDEISRETTDSEESTSWKEATRKRVEKGKSSQNGVKKTKISKETKAKTRNTENEDVQNMMKADNWCIKKEFSRPIAKLYKQLETLYKEKVALQALWRKKFSENGNLVRNRKNAIFAVLG